jgi:YfiH family protein
MIHKSFGNIELLITDAAFGHVVPSDPTFDERLRERNLEVFPTVWMDQQHTNVVVYAEKPGILKATDGIYTDQKNIRLITKTADCVPILIWHTDEPFIAALHCGWKGFFKGIIESFFGVIDQNGLNKEGFRVFLGPHIRQESLSFKQDVIDIIPEKKKKFLKIQDDLGYYDLTSGVRATLEEGGIVNIEDCGINTYTDPEYFSYRGWMHTDKELRSEHYNTFASCIILT